MPIKPCIERVPLPQEIKDHIISQREKHIKSGLSEKEADLLSAKELQEKAADELHNIYNKQGLAGYEKPIVPAPEEKQGVSSNSGEVESNVADIEKRRQQELDEIDGSEKVANLVNKYQITGYGDFIGVDRNEKIKELAIVKVNAKYDAELSALEKTSPTSQNLQVSEQAKTESSGKLKYNDKGQHLAPNGKPSLLSKAHAKLVRTPEFKKQFGDWENDKENASKVVDENGEPLLVYHGGKNFTDFKKGEGADEGIYFTDNKDFALYFAHQHELVQRDNNNDNYSDIPEDIASSGEPFEEKYLKYAKLHKAFLLMKNPKVVDAIDASAIPKNYEKGKDGFIAKTTGDFGYKGGQYVVFNPEQIISENTSPAKIENGNSTETVSEPISNDAIKSEGQAGKESVPENTTPTDGGTTETAVPLLADNLKKAREDSKIKEASDELKKYGDNFIEYAKKANPDATPEGILAELKKDEGVEFTKEEAQPLYDYVSKELEPKDVPVNDNSGTGIPPTTNDGTTEAGASDNENDFTSVRKEKLAEIKGVKKLFEQRGTKGWNETYDSALVNLAKMYPNKSLYEAMKSRINDFVTRLNNKELFNPTSEDIAVFNVFRNETQRRLSQIDGKDSDIESERFAAMAEYDILDNDLINVAKVTNPEGEAGRAFGMHQSEIRFSPEYGLKIRRMQLQRAKGGEKLTGEEVKWTKEQFDKETELNKRREEERTASMQTDFDNQLAELQRQYEQKLKDAGTTSKNTPANKSSKEQTLSQKGKKVADQIRKLKKPKGGTNIDFTLGTWDLAVEGIAKLVEAGSTVAEAIDKLVKDSVVGFKSISDKDGFENHLTDWLRNHKDREDSLDNINKYAEENKLTDITNEMVGKKLISDYVDSHIGEVDQKDILNEAHRELKKVLPDISKQRLVEAYLKENEFKQDTRKQLKDGIGEKRKELQNIAKLTEDIDDLSALKKLRQRSFPSEREQSAAEKELLAVKDAKIKEINDRKAEIKKENDALEKEAIRQVTKVQELKEKKRNLENGIREKKAKTVTEKDVPEIENLKKEVAQADKELREAESRSKKIDSDRQRRNDKIAELNTNILRAEKSMPIIKSHFNKSEVDIDKEIEDKTRQLKKAINDNATDEQVQTKKLADAKKDARNKIKEYQRKIDAGEYEEPPVPKKLNKHDAELIGLRKEQATIEDAYRKKYKELNEKNKSGIERFADFVKSTYVAFLIGHPATLAKVGYMTVLRPTSEAISKITLGKVFNAVFPGISKVAKRGGEGSSLRVLEAGIGAYFKQIGEKGFQKLYEGKQEKYNEAAKAYNDYKNSDSPNEKRLIELKNDMNSKLINLQGTAIYRFLGGSSLRDAGSSLAYRSNLIEQQFGHVASESYKDGNWLDTTNYWIGLLGRSHSAAKTFSGRFSYAASFMARLEGAVEDGRNIDSPDTMLEIANESYLDWERGKYQQSNLISDKWNEVINTIDKGETGFRKNILKAAKFIVQSDVAITRVPVNILHEALAEYTLGLFRVAGLFHDEASIPKLSSGIKKQLKEDGLAVGTPEFKAAFKERINQMDEKQAATIARCFRKGGIGAGVYALALISGAIQFGIFPHFGQKKEKEKLRKDELNPGQVMIGDEKLGHFMSGLIEHSPFMYPALMGLGLARSYHDNIKQRKTTATAVGNAIYTHLQIIQSGVPQVQFIHPVELGSSVVAVGKKRSAEAKDFVTGLFSSKKQ